jgi:O-antigen/teichoic acid export membrane protein
MSLTGRIAHGLSWSLASRICTQGFQFFFSILLARLLTPADFGIVGMLFVITGFAQAISDAGLSSALIYEQEANQSHFSTVFWLQLLAGVGICAIVIAGAPFIAQFYEMPLLKRLAEITALIFVAQALGLSHSAMLSKELRFKELAIVNVTTTLLSGVISVVLALKGYGVWSLVWPGLASSVGSTALLWYLSRWMPRFVFDGSAAKGLGRYGIYLLGHTSINYWLRNADKLVIGRALGAHELGIYTRAYSLMLLPLNNIGAVLGQVMFPELAKLQTDIPKFKSAYLSAIQLIALVMFPLMIGIAVLCEPLVLLLLGSQWREVVPVLQVLSLVAVLQSVVFPVGWIFTALGRTKDQFKLSVVLGLLFVPTIGIGILFGIMGVVYGYTLWTLLASWLNLRLAGSFIRLPLYEIIKSVASTSVMALLMGAIVFCLDRSALSGAPNYLRVGFGFAVGCTSYLALCILTKDRVFAQFTRLVFQR